MEGKTDRFTELRRIDLQITGLVYARAVREQAGGSRAELDRYTREIARQRRVRAGIEARPVAPSGRRAAVGASG